MADLFSTLLGSTGSKESLLFSVLNKYIKNNEKTNKAEKTAIDTVEANFDQYDTDKNGFLNGAELDAAATASGNAKIKNLSKFVNEMGLAADDGSPGDLAGISKNDLVEIKANNEDGQTISQHATQIRKHYTKEVGIENKKTIFDTHINTLRSQGSALPTHTPLPDPAPAPAPVAAAPAETPAAAPPVAATPAPATPAAPSVADQVTEIYQNILGRPPADLNRDLWVNRVNSGTADLSDLKEYLSNYTSNKTVSQKVIQAYYDVLGRPPVLDIPGENGDKWIRDLTNGTTDLNNLYTYLIDYRSKGYK